MSPLLLVSQHGCRCQDFLQFSFHQILFCPWFLSGLSCRFLLLQYQVAYHMWGRPNSRNLWFYRQQQVDSHLP